MTAATSATRQVRGPYENEEQAALDVEHVYRSGPGRDGIRSALEVQAIARGDLLSALLEAGVRLGQYDLDLVQKLGELQPEIVAALCGWIDRANRTSARGN